jgi:hypothetical protein
MDGCVDERMVGWMHRRLDEFMFGWREGWTYVWMDG